MEEAVTSAANMFLSAIEKATQAGPIEAPNALIAAIEAQSDPLQALSDWDARNKIFESIRSQFTFVDFVQTSGKPPSDEDLDRLCGLLRWVLQECSSWDSGVDPRRIRLVTLLVVGKFTTKDTNFWVAVPNNFRPNDDLLAALERVIAGLTTSFTTRGLSPPIWESEAIERFEKADTEGDWVGIAQGWRLIEDSFFPGIAIAEAAQCLERFAPERLVQAVSGLRQMASIMSVALSLPPHAALRLGAKSTNPHAQFATTYRAASSRANRELLGDTCKEFLTQILREVSQDMQRWAGWMRVFNCFPSQFPELQVPLGSALANADTAALQLYVDTISLHWSGQQTRFAVANCLRTFRNKAGVEKRQTLWNLAYQRWTSWEFGLKETGESLTKIARCELDYALVGYIVECLDDANRQHMLASLIKELQAVEDTWHPGIVDCLSKWYAVLSEMQPLYLAMSIMGTKAEWIDQERMMRLPFDPGKEAYTTLKYGRPQLA
ncbi:hypothetical protein KDW61_17260 [Burkholderia cenocepacia]|uniref:hypothetical protein n=1 Tax=Burkholderia TaxID=32008 RepID=UPI00158DCFDE|nr:MULTISPECIES: hypothetical protein [Burkholderia]MBR8210414.1 hypothetical protein [Burkholderia cenocepacia]